jgi:hypothetical protein
MNPVARRLPVYAADLHRRVAIHSVPHRSQRQKRPALIGVVCALGQRA